MSTDNASEVKVTIPVELLDKQIAEHEQQFEQLVKNYQQLEAEFNQKKEWAVTTTEQLRGAILALRGVKDAATTPTPPAEPPATE